MHVSLQGGFISGSTPAKLYKQGVLDLLPTLKDEAVALVDVIAPTDFVLNSPLGMSDGNMYRHLQAGLVQSPGAFERPEWWKDVLHWKRYAIKDTSPKGKL